MPLTSPSGVSSQKPLDSSFTKSHRNLQFVSPWPPKPRPKSFFTTWPALKMSASRRRCGRSACCSTTRKSHTRRFSSSFQTLRRRWKACKSLLFCGFFRLCHLQVCALSTSAQPFPRQNQIQPEEEPKDPGSNESQRNHHTTPTNQIHRPRHPPYPHQHVPYGLVPHCCFPLQSPPLPSLDAYIPLGNGD